MKQYVLSFSLISDATFGRGDGVAGDVDIEVQHDESGCPYLQGKALKGMLVAECADILNALPAPPAAVLNSAQRLFGGPGSLVESSAALTVSDARLPEDLRTAIAVDVANGKLTREQALESITAVRQQTAIESEGRQAGVAKRETLRAARVILRGTRFEAAVWLDDQAYPKEGRATAIAQDESLLAACVRAFRRAGTLRNRGRGKLEAYIEERSGEKRRVLNLDLFEKAVNP